MHEAEDEPLFAERAAGVDIAKAGIEVTVRVPSETRRGGRRQDTRSFRTTGKDLRALADRLRVWGVARIGMEPAGTTEAGAVLAGGQRAWLRAVSRRAGLGAARAAGNRQARPRRGWRRSPSGARCRAASCPRRRSAGCAPAPGTGGT